MIQVHQYMFLYSKYCYGNFVSKIKRIKIGFLYVCLIFSEGYPFLCIYWGIADSRNHLHLTQQSKNKPGTREQASNGIQEHYADKWVWSETVCEWVDTEDRCISFQFKMYTTFKNSNAPGYKNYSIIKLLMYFSHWKH